MPQPPRHYLIYSLYVIACGGVLAGLGVGAWEYQGWESAYGQLWVLIGLSLAAAQYLTTFRGSAWAAVCSATFNFFSPLWLFLPRMLRPRTAWAFDDFVEIEWLAWWLLPVFLVVAYLSHWNWPWYYRLKADAARQGKRFTFSLNECFGVILFLSLVLAPYSYSRALDPSFFRANADRQEVPFSLPRSATDITVAISRVGQEHVQFRISEADLTRWIDQETNSPEERHWKQITSENEFYLFRIEDFNASQKRHRIISDGKFIVRQHEGSLYYIFYDRDRKMAEFIQNGI